jgi:signal transduction histidine kinase
VQGGREPGQTGSGLGLYIVQGLMELHEGTVEVLDPPSGPGVRIVCALPAVDAGGQ